MQFNSANNLAVQKGLRSILMERGMWNGMWRKHEAQAALSAQPDFTAQQEWIQEVIHTAEHSVLYLPKFHCELNWIEHLWCFSKAYARQHCTYSFKDLQQVVPSALDSVPLAVMRRQARRCDRFIDAYRQKDTSGRPLGLQQASWAVKQFKSHRQIPQTVFNSLN